MGCTVNYQSKLERETSVTPITPLASLIPQKNLDYTTPLRSSSSVSTFCSDPSSNNSASDFSTEICFSDSSLLDRKHRRHTQKQREHKHQHSEHKPQVVDHEYEPKSEVGQPELVPPPKLSRQLTNHVVTRWYMDV